MTELNRPPVPVVLGPTASGKTTIGIALAKLLGGEIISVDSRKIYKGLPIGTATPPGVVENGAYVIDGIPHYLIGHLNPDQIYTAGDFARDAELLMNSIFERGKTPILVGGTGFYFKALQKGLPALPPRDEEIRAQFERRIQVEGLKSLHKELETVDQQAASSISPKDTHKLIRALEIYRLTGKPFSSWKTAEPHSSEHSFVVMGIHHSKGDLDRRIEERSEEMYKGGMIDEARAVLKAGYSKSCPALSSFGYREAVQVIEKKIKEAQFLPLLIAGTKAYAKRQRTWFRTQVAPTWFDCNAISDIDDIARRMKALLESELVYTA